VRNNDRPTIAVDHYHRFEEDLDLVAGAGFSAYRFSFAWPRIIPEGTGAVNGKGIDFYDRLLDAMLARGIRPVATLYHWDLPSSLQDKGGWMNRDIAGWFSDYAALVQRSFGDRIHALATINEPWCVAFLSHYLGIHAPGYRDIRAAARAMHHVLLAHGTAIDALRAEGAENLGIVLNLTKMEPASDAPADAAAADIEDASFNRWYLGGIYRGEYPPEMVQLLEPHLPKAWQDDMPVIARPLDWCGINYYTRNLFRRDESVPFFRSRQVRGPLSASDLGWETYPEGLVDLLGRVARDYTALPIMVTENGMSETDDGRRIDYFDRHLKAVLEARRRGVDVAGYFAWSLLDNFEWAEGYGSRFGIVHVDYATQKRTPKGSYRAFRNLLRSAVESD
jgi:beta-glucosidase